MSKESALAKNTLIMAIGTILPKISHLITLPIITAELTKNEYGTYDLITTLVSLFLPVATLQIQTAAFRFLIDCKGDEKRTKQIVTNVMGFVILASVIALTILFFVLFKIDLAIRALICVYFFTDIVFLTAVQIVRGLSKAGLYSLCTSVQPIVNMLLVVICVYIVKGGLTGALIAMTGSTIVALFIVLLKGEIIPKIDCGMFSAALSKQLIQYAWPMIPNSLSMWVLHFSDRLVLLNAMGLAATAVYGVANKIPSIYTLANSAFTLAWQENASINLDEDASEYYGSMFDNIIRILSGIMALLIGATPVLFIILIKGEYSEAYSQMPILLMAMFFSSISSFLGGIYIAHMRTKSVGATTVIAAVVNLVVDLLLVNYIGIYAASISTLVSYMFLAIYRMKNVQQFQPIKYHYGNIILYIACLMVMCIVFFQNTIPSNIGNALFGLFFALVINRTLIKKVIKKMNNKLSSKHF